MGDKYILGEDGKTPVKCDDLREWAIRFGDLARTVKRDTVNDADVSTVFLGLDHAFGSGPPVLWETMIFGGLHDGYQTRYTSYDDAVAGHAHACEVARGERAPDAT